MLSLYYNKLSKYSIPTVSSIMSDYFNFYKIHSQYNNEKVSDLESVIEFLMGTVGSKDYEVIDRFVSVWEDYKSGRINHEELVRGYQHCKMYEEESDDEDEEFDDGERCGDDGDYVPEDDSDDGSEEERDEEYYVPGDESDDESEEESGDDDDTSCFRVGTSWLILLTSAMFFLSSPLSRLS